MTTSTNNSVNTTAKINVTESNRVIESAKVTVDEAVAILNRLNYMGATFQYRFTTREYNADIEYRNFDAYKADGTGVRFSLTEIVINGKLEVVRFHNHYRNIVVDLQVGNVAYTYGYKGEIEIVETDDPEPTTNNTPETDGSEDDDAPEYVEPELGTTGGFPDLYEVTEFTDNGYGKRYTAFDNLRDAFNFANASNFPADITLIQGEQCYFICDNSGEFVTHREKFARAVHCLIEERDNKNVFDLLPELDELNDVDDDEPTSVKEEFVHMYGKSFSFININGERVSFIDGEVNIISSDKYDAHFNRKTGKYVAAFIEDGNFKPKEFDSEEEFFAEMERRGACSIDEPVDEPPTDDDCTPRLIIETKITARDSVAIKVDGKRASRASAEDKIYSNGDFTLINEFGKVFDGDIVHNKYSIHDGYLRIMRPEGNTLFFANVNAMVEHLAFDNIFHDEPTDDEPEPQTVDEHKPTVEIKTAKNGTKIFYADRKRVSRDTALKIAEQNRGENLFYLEWEHEVNAYYVGGGVESSFHTSREELRELNIKIDEYHGYTVKVNGSSLHTFRYKENAVWLVNAIIKAYVGGERGIKIERSGQVVIVDAGQSATA